ncbi:MAG: hypothetical protein ACT4OU_11990 [Hyphomicrobium sp.]
MSNEKESIEPIDDGAAKGVDGRRVSRKKPKAKADFKIDLRAAFQDPVRIKRDGGITSVDPYEAMLRQSVRKSLVEKCVTSMKRVLGEAEKHKLIKEPPRAATGGIFIVPKELPEDIQRKIFDDPDYVPDQRDVDFAKSLFGLVRDVVGIGRADHIGARRQECRRYFCQTAAFDICLSALIQVSGKYDRHSACRNGHRNAPSSGHARVAAMRSDSADRLRRR